MATTPTLPAVVVDQNYSINHEATVVNAAGQTVSAKTVLCAEAPAAILALQAAQALTKNGWQQWLITGIIGIINMLVGTFCQGTTAKA